MTQYTNLVIKNDEDRDKMIAAGLNGTWNREMLISDTGIPSGITRAAWLISGSAMDHEKEQILQQAKRSGVQVTEFMKATTGIVEFYLSQGAVEMNDEHLIIVDVADDYAEISYMKNEGIAIVFKDIKRINHGFDRICTGVIDAFRKNPDSRSYNKFTDRRQESALMKETKDVISREIISRRAIRNRLWYWENKTGAEKLYINQRELVRVVNSALVDVLNTIDNIKFRKKLGKVKILLSGRIWLCQDALTIVKEKFNSDKVMCYKPDAAAVLGCVTHLKKHGAEHTGCQLSDNYERYHCRDGWGLYCTLNDVSRRGYWKILDAVLSGKDEVIIEGVTENLEEIVVALKDDFAEVDLMWHTGGGYHYYIGTVAKPMMRVELKYYRGAREKLKKIDAKVQEILRACIGVKRCSDQEILKNLYVYMADHYHYCRVKNKSGKYPEYAYTIESLLKEGVCRGYALAMRYMLNMLQIPTVFVAGNADGGQFGSHAWNMVTTLDGDYRHLDVTWDVGKGKRPDQFRFFALNDIQMTSRKHFWKVKDYPACV